MDSRQEDPDANDGVDTDLVDTKLEFQATLDKYKQLYNFEVSRLAEHGLDPHDVNFSLKQTG